MRTYSCKNHKFEVGQTFRSLLKNHPDTITIVEYDPSRDMCIIVWADRYDAKYPTDTENLHIFLDKYLYEPVSYEPIDPQLAGVI